MRIGLHAVDQTKFPNLALMKLSAYHKSRSDQVEWLNPIVELNPHMVYDRVYLSKIFTGTDDFDTCIRAHEVIRGGSGYDLQNKLPEEIERIYPDYNLYGVTDTSYGFLTRGCPRQCGFCVVSEKEGCVSRNVSDLSGFHRDQKYIKLLDPNLLACTERQRLLQQLIDSKAWIDFTQGLDSRLLDDVSIKQLSKMKIKMIHFAWDDYKHSDIILNGLREFKKGTSLDKRKTSVYVLTNYNTDFEFDLERVYKLKELDYDPYIMIYDKEHAPKHIRHLQRWVNNKKIFRSVDRFEDFDSRVG